MIKLNNDKLSILLSNHGRAERDAALAVLDKLASNPLRFNGLSAEQQAEAAEYRQALLDVPQQDTFPESYTMPVIPVWLA